MSLRVKVRSKETSTKVREGTRKEKKQKSRTGKITDAELVEENKQHKIRLREVLEAS